MHHQLRIPHTPCYILLLQRLADHRRLAADLFSALTACRHSLRGRPRDARLDPYDNALLWLSHARPRHAHLQAVRLLSIRRDDAAQSKLYCEGTDASFARGACMACARSTVHNHASIEYGWACSQLPIQRPVEGTSPSLFLPVSRVGA
eukprot:6198826-Pleurochrysis_carterae.AAC.6